MENTHVEEVLAFYSLTVQGDCGPAMGKKAEQTPFWEADPGPPSRGCRWIWSPRISLAGDREACLYRIFLFRRSVATRKKSWNKLLSTIFFFFAITLHPRLKIPLSSNWEQILKCQGQLRSGSLKVPGLKILVRLGEQGQRSRPPAVQIEIRF